MYNSLKFKHLVREQVHKTLEGENI